LKNSRREGNLKKAGVCCGAGARDPKTRTVAASFFLPHSYRATIIIADWTVSGISRVTAGMILAIGCRSEIVVSRAVIIGFQKAMSLLI
jgi:hypothetical protein